MKTTVNVSGPCCRICGKALSDPVSIERGIGPECHGKYKRSQHADKTGNLFANRSKYSWGIDWPVLWIQDENGMKSVTNDIEFVLGDIFNEIGVQLFDLRIMYRDSMGIWDGIIVKNSHLCVDSNPGVRKPEFIEIYNFFAIHETDYRTAKVALLSLSNKPNTRLLTTHVAQEGGAQ